jgi:hypothetical protein
MKYEIYAKFAFFGIAVAAELHDGYHSAVYNGSGFLALLATLSVDYLTYKFATKTIAEFLQCAEDTLYNYLLFSMDDLDLSDLRL